MAKTDELMELRTGHALSKEHVNAIQAVVKENQATAKQYEAVLKIRSIIVDTDALCSVTHDQLKKVLEQEGWDIEEREGYYWIAADSTRSNKTNIPSPTCDPSSVYATMVQRAMDYLATQLGLTQLAVFVRIKTTKA